MTLKRYIPGAILLMLAWTITVSAQNPIQIENALPGTRDWQNSKEVAYARQIEGYASKVSIDVGGEITFYVTLRDGSTHYDLEIYRMGWYGSTGGRLIFTRTGIESIEQTDPSANLATGLQECNWVLPGSQAQHSWTHPGASGPPSGYYLAKITTNGTARKSSSYIPFTVRDDARVSDFLFQASVTTWQAYNHWPSLWYPSPQNPNLEDPRNGKSLYYNGDNSANQANWGPPIPAGDANGRQARAVSFNRPYTVDNGTPYYTAGQFFIRGEYNMARWMEKKGYDVTYTTDVDTDAAMDMVNGPLSPGRHKVFLSVGHDEYWSWQMRENIEKARNRPANQQPLNIGWFGANNVYWQIRFANSSLTNTAPADKPRRTMIAYKELATSINSNWKDPLYTEGGSSTNYLTTTLWRNMKNPEMGTQCPFPNCFKYPEDEIVGVMLNRDNPGGRGTFEFGPHCPEWVKENVENPDIGFGGLVGYEADHFLAASNNYPGRAGEAAVIGDSEFIGQYKTTRAHAVYYEMSGGARVFAAGTIEWGLGLDSFGSGAVRGPALHPDYYDPRLEIVTRNILACLRDGGAACS